MDDRFGAVTYAKCAHFNSFLAKHARFRRDCYTTGFGSSLNSMRQIQAEVRKEAQTMIEQYQTGKRDPTDRENARLDELSAVLGDLTASMDGRIADMDRERALPAWTGSRLSAPKAGSKLCADLFAGKLESGGFRDLHDFLNVFRSGRHDERIQAAVSQERDGSGSGYLIPSQFVGNLLDASLESEIVRSRADSIAMESNEAHAPAWDTLDNSSGAIGGLTGQWLEQGGTATTQAAKFRAIKLIAKKMGLFCAASNEMIQDATMFATKLETAMVQALAWHLDHAFLRGTGAGQPLGVLNDPALVTVAKESGQAADTVKYANLARMFARLHPASLARSIWVANSTTIPALLQLFATDGTTSTHVPVLQQTGDGGFTMLTRPCVFSEKVPLLGDAGDLLLVDFSQYVCGLRKEASIERSQHVGWATDDENFRLLVRADGKGKWSAPFAPKNGSTLSWCVTLAERA